MRTFKRNIIMNKEDFFNSLNGRIVVEKSWLDKVKRFLGLPYYELVTIYNDEKIKETYLIKNFKEEIYIF